MASCPACAPVGGVGANGDMASAVDCPVRVLGRVERMLCEVVPRSALITMQDSGYGFRRMGERRSSANNGRGFGVDELAEVSRSARKPSPDETGLRHA